MKHIIEKVLYSMHVEDLTLPSEKLMLQPF